MYAILLTLSLMNPGSEEPTLSGQPVWFPLGGEVYHERDRHEAARSVLKFRAEPHWFLGFPKPANQQEFEAWLKSLPGLQQDFELQDGQFQIPTAPAQPQKLTDLPLQDQGASLKFTVEPSTNPEILEFRLDLTATGRAIRREIEHRHTNVIPFLFAFYVDGKAIRKEATSHGTDGGSRNLVELVPAKSHQQWSLRVARKSMETILPADAATVTIVAAFAERQHEEATESPRFDGEVWDLRQISRQILIRSNPVTVTR
ncbi:MAG: hypothetical protein JSS49_11810 [Planctomycetes bacterium]|nr:hypothetical protein [Planctomycetota bacterium]